MAKKIELGFVLSGKDAEDFIKNWYNPEYTKAARRCMKAALRMAEERKKIVCYLKKYAFFIEYHPSFR